MFRCKARIVDTRSTYREEMVDAIYIESVVTPHNQMMAVILVDKKLVTVPLGDVTWTGWID